MVVDQYCHYYPENVKPKPKLQECNMEPCLDRWDTTSLREFTWTKHLISTVCMLNPNFLFPFSDGYKQIMPYDLYHPLPRCVFGYCQIK